MNKISETKKDMGLERRKEACPISGLFSSKDNTIHVNSDK